MRRLILLSAVPLLLVTLVAGARLSPAAATAWRWWQRAPRPVLAPLDTTASPLGGGPAGRARPVPGGDVRAVTTWLARDDVRALAWDPGRGRLWAATAGGLLSLTTRPGPGEDCRLPATSPDDLAARVDRSLPSLSLHDVLVDPHGVLWVASEAGVVRLGADGPRVLDAGLRSPRVVTLAWHGDRLWAGTAEGGLHRLEGTRFAPVPLPGGPQEITALHSAGDLWVGTPAGLWRVPAQGRARRVLGAWIADLGSEGGAILATGPEGTFRLGEAAPRRVGPPAWRLVRPGPATLLATLGGALMPLGDVPVAGPGRGAVQDALAVDGAVWWATADGLVLADAAGHLHALPGSGLPSNALTSAALSSGRLVVGTWERGLAVLAPEGFRPLAPGVSQINHLLPTSPAEWPGDAVWAATPHGLYRVPLDGTAPRRLGQDDGLASEHATALARGPDGSLWVATAGGLSRVRSEGPGRLSVDTYDRRHGLPDAPLQSVAVTDGGAVVAGSLHGLVRLEGGRAQVTGPGDGRLPDGWVTALAPAGDTLWIGTYDAGVVRQRGRRWERLAWDPGGAGDRVHPGALVVDRGRLLVGTQGAGLWVRDPDGGLRRYGRAEGLPSEEVTAVVPDGPHLWVATRGGLARLTLARGGVG